MGRATPGVDRTPQARAPVHRDASRSVSRTGRSFPIGRRALVSVFPIATVGLVFLSCSADIARAHVPGDSGGPVVGLAAIVAASVVVSLLGGFALAVAEGRRGHRSAPYLGVAFGALLTISGGLAVSAAAFDDLAVAAVGALTGAFLVRSFSAHAGSGGVIRHSGDETRGSDRHAGAALGAVVVHRAIEGLTVAAVYTAGSAIGVLGAVVLAGHATAETVAVGGLYLGDRVRVLGAVCLVQIGFVVGAVVGQVTTVPFLPAHRFVLLAVVGGVLLVVGGSETYARLRSGIASEPVQRVRR